MNTKEELRGQLGERLYGAFNLASEAMGMTTKQMNKALEQGQVLAADLLPKLTPLIKKLANNNSALATQLESARIAENRFIHDYKAGAKTIFNSGFEEGLKELYTTLSEEISGSGKSQEDLGNIYKKFFKTLAGAIKVLMPVLEAFIQGTSKLIDLAALSVDGYKQLYDTLNDMHPALGRTAAGVLAIGLAMRTVTGKVLLAIGAFQELISLFDDKVVGAFEASMGKQVNLLTMQTTELIRTEDGYFNAKDRLDMMPDMDAITKAIGGDKITEVLQKSFGMSLEEFNVALKDGKVSLVDFKSALSEELVGSVFESKGALALMAGVIGGAIFVIIKFKRMLEGVVGLGKSLFKFATGSNLPDSDLKKPKPKGSYKPKTFGAKQMMGRLATGALSNISKVSLPALAMSPTMMGDADLYKPDMTKPQQVTTGSNFGLPTDKQIQMTLNSLNNPDKAAPTVNVSGFEISVNVADPSQFNPTEIGRDLGKSFSDQLEQQLTLITRGGR